MTPLPPRPTLFPYTTLFRSSGEIGDDLQRAIRPADIRLRARLDQQTLVAQLVRQVGAAALAQHLDRTVGLARHQIDHREAQDRKSTRLNSSHTVISYAVFCL